MLCAKCFWNTNKYRKKPRKIPYFKPVDPNKHIFCPFFGILKKEGVSLSKCDGYILEESTMYWVKKAKEKILDTEFTKKEKRAKACISISCQPTRLLLEQIKDCAKFREVALKRMKSLTKSQYDELFVVADEIIKKLETVAHQRGVSHHSNINRTTYTNKRAIVCVALNKGSVVIANKYDNLQSHLTQRDLERMFFIIPNIMQHYSPWVEIEGTTIKIFNAIIHL